MGCLLFLFAGSLIQLVAAQQVCPDSSWTYYPLTGSCYQIFTVDGISFYNASASCSNYSAQLVSIDSMEEQAYLDRLLQYNYNKVWIGLTYNASTDSFVWMDGWTLNLTSRWGSGNPDKMFTNVYMYKDILQQELAYQLYLYWFTAFPNTNGVSSYICEFVGPRCPPVANVANATASTWKNYYNLTVTWSCLEGFLLPSEALPAENVTIEQYYTQSSMCMMNSSNMTYWSVDKSQLFSCKPKYCNSTPTFQTGGTYPNCDSCNSTALTFDPGFTINYSCNPGYRVPYGNSTVAKVICGNDPSNPLANTWKPRPTLCVIVTCPPLANFMPNNSLSPTGVDLNGRQIPQGASQFLVQYGSVVNLTCQPGYIYQDGLITRQYKCNAASTVGYWTIVTPNAAFSMAGCNPVNCPNISAQIESYISTGMNVTGDYRQTLYLSQFSVTCANGWTFPDSSTTKTITCNALQRWDDGTSSFTSLTGCIAIGKNFAGSIVGQKYQPPKQEAANASAKSGTIITLTGLFIAIVILMDLAALPREISILRRNWARLRERCKNKPDERDDWTKQLINNTEKGPDMSVFEQQPQTVTI